MPRRLNEQCVVVAGASSGIGRTTAKLAAGRGARVVTAARGSEALDTLVAEIRGNGGDAVAVPTDVAEFDQVRQLAETAAARYGRIDTWVNAAAVHVYSPFEEIPVEEYDRVMRVNFLGQVHGVYAALPHLRAAGGGTIIGLSSAEGLRAVPLQAPYVSSKWALRGFYDTIRMELMRASPRVHVTTILPAGIDTPIFSHARSRLPGLPKPPPPVYAPEVVAETIAFAAEHPGREIPVGGAVLGFMLMQRFAPALADRLMTVGGAFFRGQVMELPNPGEDNLTHAAPGPGSERGRWPGRTHTRSPFTTLVWRHPWVSRLALSTAAAALVGREARRG